MSGSDFWFIRLGSTARCPVNYEETPTFLSNLICGRPLEYGKSAVGEGIGMRQVLISTLGGFEMASQLEFASILLSPEGTSPNLWSSSRCKP